MSREYFIEVKILDASNGDFAEWKFVKGFVETVPENFTSADTDQIAFNIRKAVEKYEKEEL